MAALDFDRREVVCLQAGRVEGSPILFGEFEDLRLADREGNNEPVLQSAKDSKQPSFAEIDQAGSIVDNDARHWALGPLILCSMV